VGEGFGNESLTLLKLVGERVFFISQHPFPLLLLLILSLPLPLPFPFPLSLQQRLLGRLCCFELHVKGQGARRQNADSDDEQRVD
jgi:hypothetical protein